MKEKIETVIVYKIFSFRITAKPKHLNKLCLLSNKFKT
ncbi:hypothetical protein ENHAE0001_0783 [Enhydrobacter aerosaccus SK60]|nr:hypothetical protein ENHAE0001_0783 [Enhydrobacter aerosaccus SK60]